MKCGFKIGGGIDQDFRKSPQGYSDYVWQFLNICIENYKDLAPKHDISYNFFYLTQFIQFCIKFTWQITLLTTNVHS